MGKVLREWHRHKVVIELVTQMPQTEAQLTACVKSMLGPWCDKLKIKVMNVVEVEKIDAKDSN